MKPLDRKTVKSLIKPRGATTHKGDHGHALLITGSKGKMGAAFISSRACLRSGAGLLTVNVPAEERFVLQSGIPEAMIALREDRLNVSGFSAIGIGPGLRISKASEKLVKQVLSSFHQPVVWDADALNIFSANKSLLKKLQKGAILTPHPKEFDRLFGAHQNLEQRTRKAIEMAAKLDCVLVLKGFQTIITSKQGTVVNTTGNAGLAKGGSGDALTGIITAFLAQGYAPFTAARLGVYLHGLAADLAAGTQSLESMLITDVIECLGAAFKQLLK